MNQSRMASVVFCAAMPPPSKSGQVLGRYFPEITVAAVTLPESDYVDGELAIPAKRGFSFDNLLQRIHPAESRIRRLAVETPALFIAFDILVRNGIDLGARFERSAAHA